VLASLAPLAMHVLGWDLYRWDALAVWTSFLVFVLVQPVLPITMSRPQKNAILLVLVLNAVSYAGLIDNDVTTPFPDVHQAVVGARLLLGRPQHVHPPVCPEFTVTAAHADSRQ
jgi:hypothetical protein